MANNDFTAADAVALIPRPADRIYNDVVRGIKAAASGRQRIERYDVAYSDLPLRMGLIARLEDAGFKVESVEVVNTKFPYTLVIEW